MGPYNAANSRGTEELLSLASEGDRQVLGQLFSRYATRLERMVRFRMDRRLQGRLDVGDVLQEAYIEAMHSLSGYLSNPATSFFVWLRCITGRKLIDLHRHHLRANVRDARREISLDGRAPAAGAPAATSEALAARLLGRLTSPSEVFKRAERRARLEEALNGMESLDREILTLRHLEQLSNAETAEVLGITESAASKRHVRALGRLKKLLRSSGGTSSW